VRTTYEGPEYPDFIAVGNDAVGFGLSRRPDSDPAASAFTWQLGVRDVDAAIAAGTEAGLSFEVAVERPREDRTYRVVRSGPRTGWRCCSKNRSRPSTSRPKPTPDVGTGP
jgi:hypothetical protein